MPTLKAGCILINTKTRQIGLVYRHNLNDLSFPKGHLEEGETLAECAVRETEEETLRANHLAIDTPIHVIKYTTPKGEECENYMYLSIDDGPTTKNIAIEDREVLRWASIDEVEDLLSYENLKDVWRVAKPIIEKILL